MIFAVEEPEASQHPQNQALIIEALKDLAARGDQVLITTHVPALAALLPVESVRFLDRPSPDDTPSVQTTADDESLIETVAESLGVLPSPVARDVEKLLVVAVAEGPSECEQLIAMSRVLHDAGVIDFTLDEGSPEVFVTQGGGSTLKHVVNRGYLDKLGLPQVHVYDSDKENEGHPGKLATLDLAAEVKQRPGCTAFITRKRATDNYLHPHVVSRLTNGAVNLSFGPSGPDYDAMADVVYEQLIVPTRQDPTARLNAVDRSGAPLRPDKRNAKSWITYLMSEMTSDELLERGQYTGDVGDRRNEITEWFTAIQAHVRRGEITGPE